MDAESIAALAMCGMVGEAAAPSIRTPIGEVRVNDEVDVRYSSDGGFYRAKVSAIDAESIAVTYPEDQVSTLDRHRQCHGFRAALALALPRRAYAPGWWDSR